MRITGTRRVTLTTLAALAILSVMFIASFVLVRGRAVYSQTSSGAITQDWVNQKLVEWKPTTISPMGFGGVFSRASYDNILLSYNTPQVESADLAMLESSGATYVRIDIGFDAWLQNKTTIQQELTTLAGQINTDGKKLIIADAAAESYRHGGGLPWTQFQQAWVERVKTLAGIFHPAYYIVIKEPGWYVPMITDIQTNPAASSPSSWLNLTSTLASTVHAASPSTQVGVAIAADSLSSNPTLYVPYLRGLSNITGVSFMGFDLYTATGYTLTQNFLTQYGNQGKAVWIAEAWSADAPTAFDSTRASLDASWIWAAYYFGQLEHAQMIVPFFTDLFASYTLPTSTDSTQILSSYGDRTPVFSSYSDMISGKPGPVVSQTSTTSTPASTSNTSSQTGTGTQTSPQGGNLAGGLGLPLIIAAALVIVVVAAALVYAVRRRK